MTMIDAFGLTVDMKTMKLYWLVIWSQKTGENMRIVLDWEAQRACAMDPETAKKVRDDRKPEHEDTCSMCGKFCAVRSMNKALAGEHIDIL